ncbi:uncharacterized protein ACLA_025110 [Aspergillus clavatus NRRL 1]|uniref:Uncharacterized protein n=1 Tax=Aspergillus clavatus (strain ATCC 1007 / CBS 513.65 / DSM 816 / NCTC 3887 / NRRL 1 / QM 1276 / 107) TaxID=344612 RepID=A1CQ73_ASPCL|nr:uncharacterized protein ACLA_025110 [Aspergillus clavatus NRRL 1]EAW07794.1 hypothetical protein ACLA_025110 [Aspergillus clavatus NRRL 1]
MAPSVFLIHTRLHPYAAFPNPLLPRYETGLDTKGGRPEISVVHRASSLNTTVHHGN